MSYSMFDIVFYGAGAFSVITTTLAITRKSPVYALLNFVMSILGIALVIYVLGAPFAASLEVIVYAGAVVVLFLFVVMMLNLEHLRTGFVNNRGWIAKSAVPVVLAISIMIEIGVGLSGGRGKEMPYHIIGPAAVGRRLLVVDIIPIELGSMLLLAALLGAFHLARLSPEKVRQ
jgi:NADH-quinone oxidoreductase subunit J